MRVTSLARLSVARASARRTFASVAAAASAGAPVEKFQQLDQLLPTPSAQRNAAGAPGAPGPSRGASR